MTNTRTRPCKARLPHAAQNLAEVRRMITKAPASYRAVEIPLRWNNDLTWSFTVRFRDRLGPGAVQLPNISRLGRIKWSKCSWSRIVEPAPTSRCNSYWVDYSLESDLLYPVGSRFPSSRLSTETFVRQHKASIFTYFHSRSKVPSTSRHELQLSSGVGKPLGTPSCLQAMPYWPVSYLGTIRITIEIP